MNEKMQKNCIKRLQMRKRLSRTWLKKTHALWGLQQQGYQFELKVGISLSKAFNIIDRFSEDIDVHINPDPKYKLTSKTKQTDKKYTTVRQFYFDELTNEINISNMPLKRDKKI